MKSPKATAGRGFCLTIEEVRMIGLFRALSASCRTALLRVLRDRARPGAVAGD